MSDHDPELLSDAEGEAVGRRIRALAQEVQAPDALRARIADAHEARPRRDHGGGAAAWLRRPRIALPALGGLAAAAAVVLALVLGGGAAGPSVGDAATLALAQPTRAAPAVVGSTGLAAREAGITFPNYAYEWPRWRATGAREDSIGGRGATTVTYGEAERAIGYTIVDGEPLAIPDHARRLTVKGTALAIYEQDGATVVTWRRDGHTCVLAGRGPGAEARMIAFATWT